MMRALCLLTILPLVAACEPEPVPQPEPPMLQPELVEREVERRDHLSGAAQTGDFKVNFGEPYIQFENRGGKMAISQSYRGANYRIVDVSTSRDGDVWVFRGSEGAIPGDEPFVLTIERKPCSNPSTRENTKYIASLGTAADPNRAISCAAPAR